MTTPATIAVIDDDESVRQSLRELLRSADYLALTYESAEEFLDGLNGQHIDCMIVDVNLPGMSGVALVQTLAARGNTTPVVLITARDDPATLDLMRRLGGVPHLRKPFSDDALFSAISRMLS